MSTITQILQLERDHCHATQLDPSVQQEYYNLFSRFNSTRIRAEMNHLYDMETHRTLTYLEKTKKLLLYQISNEREVRALSELKRAQLEKKRPSEIVEGQPSTDGKKTCHIM